MSFQDKVVIVTGAGSGIGAATAVLFAREGARVALVGRNEAALNEIAQECAAHGTQPLIIKANVANEQEAKTIIKRTIDQFGKLDVLVNNAGIMRKMLISDPNILETFDLVMNTNLRSVVQLTNLAVPHLKATKGNVVNVSSTSAIRVINEFMSYCVSKTAVHHFTRCAASELAASGIRVNCVNPGRVMTNILQNSGVDISIAEVLETLKSVPGLRKVAEPEEIAGVIAFLASDKAGSITGSGYFVDNGSILAN